MASPSGCETCNKSSLSFLLLRPSPIANNDGLMPNGSRQVVTSNDVVAGIIPKRAPTESRVVLRRLRAGYVHIYTPNLVGNKHWHIFRVTEQGDIVRKDSAFFAQPKANFTCPKSIREHNAAGLQLVSLPQAHLIKEFWIAFSANLWSDKIRAQNQANPEQMQRISIDNGSENTFKPTAGALRSRVLECHLTQLKIGETVIEADPRFNPITDVDRLADELTLAAARHPKTKGKELAIVLRDPVAFTTELNALRLLRHKQAEKEGLTPRFAHGLNSSQTLMGLKEILDKTSEEQAVRELSFVQTKRYFDNVVKDSFDPRFAGAKWIPLTIDLSLKGKDGTPLGRVWLKKNLDKRDTTVASIKENNWEKITDHYDEKARLKCLADFHKVLSEKHFVPLGRYEADWWAAREDTQFVSYFEQHFDENDRNNPKDYHSPGFVYTKEASGAMTPAPLTDGVVCEKYVDQFFADAIKPSSILLRALGANQKEVVHKIAELSTKSTLKSYAVTDRNDKLYDLGSAIVQQGAERLSPKYSWLATVGGSDGINAFSLGIAQSGIAAASVLALRAGATWLQSSMGQNSLAKLKTILFIPRVLDLASRSVLSRTALQTPMVITKEYSALHLLFLTGGRTVSSLDMLERHMSNGRITIEIVTDSRELLRFANDVDQLIVEDGGKLRAKGAAPEPGAVPDLPRTIHLTDAQLDRAVVAHNKYIAAAANWTQESLFGTTSVIKSLEGRLALGAALINLAGLLGNIDKLKGATGSDRRDAIMGIIDAGSSTFAALAQVLEVGVRASKVGRLGEEAAKKSLSIASLRAVGTVLGTVGGLMTVAGQAIKATDAFQNNQNKQGALYVGSGACFLVVTLTSGAAAAGAIADWLVIRGVAGAVASQFALRLGVGSAAMMLGVALPVWGLVLLGVALALEIAAVLMTRTELQEWVQSTYFGYGEGKLKKFDSWQAEEKALKEVGAKKDAEKQEKTVKVGVA